jgi:phenylalanyl-tRNA synthetase beta subunit
VDTYANDKKFGTNMKSYSFRIRYRSHIRTLTNNEINEVQDGLRQKVTSVLGGILR